MQALILAPAATQPLRPANYVRRIVLALSLVLAALGLAWMAPSPVSPQQRNCPSGTVVTSTDATQPAGCIARLRSDR